MKWLDNLTGNYKSSARIVDGTLVLSLPDATSPVVWRMALADANSFALEVQNNKDETYSLVFKTSKEDVEEIAPFDKKGKAVRALMVLSRAMEQAPVKATVQAAIEQSTQVNSKPAAKGGFVRFIFSVFGLILLVFLVFALTQMQPGVPQSVIGGGDSGAAQLGDAGETGVPMSADDFLRAR